MLKIIGERGISNDITLLEEPPFYNSIIKELDVSDEIYSKFILINCFFAYINAQLFLIEFEITNFVKNRITSNIIDASNRLVYYLRYMIDKLLLFGDFIVYNIKNSIMRFDNLSKKGDMRRVISLIIFSFIVYFLFLSVLPGGERTFVCAANDNTCNTPSAGTTGDNAIADCTAYGQCNSGGVYAVTNAFGTCSGDTSCADSSCCGDDTGEFYEYCLVQDAGGMSWEANCATADDACCGQNSCVGRLDTQRRCYARSTGHVITGESGNDQVAFCSSVDTWRDCDYGSSQCSACDTAAGWTCSGIQCWVAEGESVASLPGEYTDGATECCGDDLNENFQNRNCYQSGTSGIGKFCDNSTADAVCCNAVTDCVYNSVCYAAGTSGVNLDGSGEADATCQSRTTYGRWVDCDLSSTWCGYCDTGTDLSNCVGTACFLITGESSGHGEYSAGETECCGDDSNENIRTRQVLESLMENDYADNTSDTACCAATTDCVNSFTCYDDGDTSTDADGDGDNDYCNSGTWNDCLTADDCAPGKICLATYDCANPYGNILINNLGTTGIENTNQEFTSSRSVSLDLYYHVNATHCRYTNYPVDSELPANDYANWTTWESCIGNRFWLLTETPGVKVVYYQLNISNPKMTKTYNDTIYYNFTGGGLDTTGPTKPIVYHSNYTNDPNNAVIMWYNSSDEESAIFGIPLKYIVKLYNSSYYELGSVETLQNRYNFSFSSQAHGTVLYANVTVINSANLRSNATSGPLTIDLVKPNINTNGSVFNVSKQAYQRITNPASWFYSNKAQLSWNASDSLSGVSEYSYILSLDKNKRPDYIADSTILQKLYTNLKSGVYYFYVIANDKAGNWGDPRSVNFSVDSTPPSRPLILTNTPVSGGVKFTWSESADPESDIAFYMINLTTSTGTFIESFNQTNVNNKSHTFTVGSSGNFNATVGALNGAGIWMWSNGESSELDITEPEIYLLLNVTVATNYPIIKAWTNEPTVCIYNGIYNGSFIYSNTTYHETKLLYHDNLDYSYVITCIDPAGNQKDAIIHLSIDSAKVANGIVSTIQEIKTYENLITSFQIRMDDLGELITGLEKSDARMTIDGNSYPFDMFDIGNGYYNISFMAPVPGDYLIGFNSDYDSIQLNMTSKKLDLNARYLDASYITGAPENKKTMTYYISDRLIGFASDDEIDVRDVLVISGQLDLNSSVDSNLFIFNSKKSTQMNDRDNRLAKNKFINLINPSFGYPISEDYILNYVIEYDNFDLISKKGTLKQGAHKVKFSKTGPEEITIKSGNDGSQSVLTG